MNNTTLLQALNWRYATKSFDASRRLDADQLQTLSQALQLAPSSFGLQPWQFLIIENADLRAKLREQSWGQAQITDASHLVVLTVKEQLSAADVSRWVQHLATVQSTPLEALAPLEQMMLGFVNNMSAADSLQWNSRQVYIALGQLMTAAAVLGIDSCPIEGINPAAYDEILQLQGSGYRTLVVCALGFRAEDDKYASKPKARYALADVVKVIS